MYDREIVWQGHKLSIKTQGIAPQTDSSVLLRYADTVVLATVVIDSTPKDIAHFIPLSVHYIEKAYAARKIPGGFIKREGKNQDHEVLISRMIDRGLRPLFPQGLQNEVQIIITVLDYDPKVGSIVPSFLAASIALYISPLPIKSPVGISHIIQDSETIINPTYQQSKNARHECYIAGTKNRIIMIEGGTTEITNKDLLSLIKKGIRAYHPILELIETIPKASKKKKLHILKTDQNCKNAIYKKGKAQLQEIFSCKVKKERSAKVAFLKHKLLKDLSKDFRPIVIERSFQEVSTEILTSKIFQTKKRIDDRKIDEIRPITIETTPLPNAHGSAIFTRGETQVLSILTIGKPEERQYADELSGYKGYNFLFHYNFPPFCVGETDKLGPPSRRDIGHGHIGYRAILPMLPDNLYTYRIVSEVLSSNGSSSMASVCAASLALITAGVKIKKPVAGIALGYLRHKNDDIILVDILGDEDHLGCMDLKVTGTEQGITALQLDVACSGISINMLQKSLTQSTTALNKILRSMHRASHKVKASLPDDINRIDSIKIDPTNVKTLVGKSGQVIREIEKTTKCRIEIKDQGRVIISSNNWKNVYAAKKIIRHTMGEPEKNKTYQGTVSEIDEKNIFVKFNSYLSGVLKFQSQKEEKRLRKKLKVGKELTVEFHSFNRKGNINLSFISL